MVHRYHYIHIFQRFAAPKRVEGQLCDSADDRHNGIVVIPINDILLLVLGHTLLDQAHACS